MRRSDDQGPTLDARTRDPDVTAIDGAQGMIDERKQDWTGLLQELIRIPSCFEAEHAIVRRVCEHVAAIGLAPTLVPMDACALRRHADAIEPISTRWAENIQFEGIFQRQGTVQKIGGDE